MKRSLSPSKELKNKRAFIIDDAPLDPLEDSPVQDTIVHPPTGDGVNGATPVAEPVPTSDVVRVDPDLAMSFDTLADFVETGDLDGLHEKLKGISEKVSKIQDNKVRGVYASLNKVWSTIGFLKHDIQNLKEGNDAWKLDKAYGQSNRLYAWMKHIETIKPELALPEMNKWSLATPRQIQYRQGKGDM